MGQVAQGGSYTWPAVIRDANGNLADCSDLTLVLTDPSGAVLSGFPVGIPPIVRDSTGMYHYVWAVPSNATLGLYSATWSGILDVTGVAASGYDSVEVVAQPNISTTVAYATLAPVQARLVNYDHTDALELQRFCDETNAWIEQKTGRVLGPYPTFETTLGAPAAIGATTVTLASVTGLNLQDELAFGPVTGTHESSPVVGFGSGTDVVLGVPLANAYLSGAAVERVYLRDGFDASVSDDMTPGRVLVEMRGVVTLSALEIASYTRGPFAVIPLSDVFLRPVPNDRMPGWPATEIVMTNIPSPTNPYPSFFPGYGNIRYWGQLGWPAVPQDIVGLAERVVVALWQMRTGGGAYSVEPGRGTAQQIPHLLSYDDWKLLNSYTARTPPTGIIV